jgi:hypothetical protein
MYALALDIARSNSSILIEALEPVVASFFGDIGRARIRRRLSAMAMELFMYLICLAYMKNSITHTYLCPCL